MSILDSILIYDVETTMYQHQDVENEEPYNIKDRNGSAFCLPQRLVSSGFQWIGDKRIHAIQGEVTHLTQCQFDKATLIVGFNIKFDLHWARRIGVDISKVVVWDCQIAEFIISNQTKRFPSLNDACARYDIPGKLDVVAIEYWDKGIDTDEVPHDVLEEYLFADLDRTKRVFLEQLFYLRGIQL